MADDTGSRCNRAAHYLFLHSPVRCRRDGHQEVEQPHYRRGRFLYRCGAWFSLAQRHYRLLQVKPACRSPAGCLSFHPKKNQEAVQ